MNAFYNTASWANPLAAAVLVVLGATLATSSLGYYVIPPVSPFVLTEFDGVFQVVDGRNGDVVFETDDEAAAVDNLNIVRQLKAIGFDR